ncbi:uncharacterized, partial [Tachysurus ichikawai]
VCLFSKVEFEQRIRIEVKLKHRCSSLGFGSVTSESRALRPLKANTVTLHTFTFTEIDVESPETPKTRKLEKSCV